MGQDNLIKELDKQINNLKRTYKYSVITMIIGIILAILILIPGVIIFVFGMWNLSKAMTKVNDLKLKKAEVI